MTSRRPLILAVAAAAVLAPEAAAQAPQPTLAFDGPCYTADQFLAFSGAGYTPSGPIGLALDVASVRRAGFTGSADAAGAIDAALQVREDDLLLAREDRAAFTATATDETRTGAGDPASATARFTFTRWAGFSPGRYVPGRKVEVEAFGWAFAAGKPLYFLFQRKSRTVASVRAGSLSADCGDLVARIRVPRKLKPGAYRLVLSTERRRPSGLYTWRKGRVVRRATASAASADRAMARG